MDDTGRKTDTRCPTTRPGPWWWLGQLLLTAVACFFACFGILLLVGAYGLKDPYAFIMTFFGASLMILISLVMAMGFVVRMHRVLQTGGCESNKDGAP
jgi:hypothetical protein